MTPEQIWQAVLGELELQMTRATYDTWLRDTRVVTREANTFVVGVPTAYVKDWLENRLSTTVNRTIAGICGKRINVEFVIHSHYVDDSAVDPAPFDTEEHAPVPAFKAPEPQPEIVLEAEVRHGEQHRINPQYRFRNFVVGTSNRLAHAASIAVADNPATAYNPLFIHGGVGLGKTHLLHAIGNRCVDNGLSVLYVSSEEFTNDLINAIRSHTTEEFREKYRQIDVLLIDDIQFIAGKESTQEEMFHTFNTLHGDSKQIVFSSDRSPKALVTLEERLRSRFEWGLTADIQAPDVETRIAILQQKAEKQRRIIPSDVIELLAQRVKSNIRELEGAFNRVIAHADILNHPLDTNTAQHAISDLMPNRQAPTIEMVLTQVARYFAITVEALESRTRKRAIAVPRQIAMYILRTETELSLPQIGKGLGGRDHTTIMHGIDKIEAKIDVDEDLKRDVLSIRDALYK